jgi:hypothetical protein
MLVIISNCDGTNRIEFNIPDKVFQALAKGEYTEIMQPIEKGPMPNIITIRHDFK